MKHKISRETKDTWEKGEEKNKYKKVFLIFIASFIVFMAGLLILHNKNDADNKIVENKDVITDIQDDVQAKAEEDLKKKAEEKAALEVSKIETEIEKILGDNKTFYGIYYYDFNSGLEYSVNGDKEFHAASTIKVPIAMMISDKLYNKEISEDMLIEYTLDNREDGAGVLQGSIVLGDKIKVSDLMKHMIEESDNIATSMLKKNLSSVPEYIMKVTGVNAGNDKNYITPRQSYTILKKLYEESESNVYYKKVLQMMKETSSHDRLDKYIPIEMISHKIGDYDQYVNDIGIVHTKEPYILVVYTKGVMEEGRENIARISKAIYDIKTSN
ncbi:MAG: class A beta-lactamase-related serine hydrolase [Clostridium sp.]|uniref:serine hydrolase n=1 Tax=Clostridium sp. DSM 8431 TaxID=1761781 RepID=UPI0008E21112|nr:serine hydrolase [Clostridium sp. DSM 8431]MCR4944166.1 class A beta-lactamase-related serine hydrolase [Clostridium sp.]SFU50171.1 beta-lactamase class A [Clostridium sp. DSM 8431]